MKTFFFLFKFYLLFKESGIGLAHFLKTLSKWIRLKRQGEAISEETWNKIIHSEAPAGDAGAGRDPAVPAHSRGPREDGSERQVANQASRTHECGLGRGNMS